MPLVTNVIDDVSPLIVYDATWLPGTSHDDPFGTDYYLGTFTTNNVTNGAVTFNFNGTAIWIYGGKRPNHGSYIVQVDGATYTNFNGAGSDLIQQIIFNTSALTQKMHSITLTNTATGSLYVDIDMIVWQSQVGNTNNHLNAEVVQDTDSRFQYQEPAWGTTSNTLNFGLFNNGTGHATQTYSTSVTFTFTGILIIHCIIRILTHLSGEAISLFGTSGPSNGPYSAQLDGGQIVQYNASNGYDIHYGVMIYHADNLGPGSHQLVLTNLPAQPGQSLSIDYAQLLTTANNVSPNASSNSLHNELNSGTIAGIIIAAAVAVLNAGVALFFYRRWKAAMAGRHDVYRFHTSEPWPPVVGPTGFSSSLETRSNASLMRNETPNQALTERAQQPSGNYTVQHNSSGAIASGSYDSRGVVDTANPLPPPTVDEGVGRRPLPEAPGGGLSLSDEFPKLTSPRRRQSATTTDHNSIALSDFPPPNYSQAVGNAASTPGQTHDPL